MRRRSFGALGDAALGSALFALALVVFLRATATTPFHGDESEWISAGRYFKFVAIDHDVTSGVWRPSWDNRDQPPIGRYVIGGVVWASGGDVGNLNKTYAWDKDLEANRREGRVPGPELLQPVRNAMALFGALSVLGLYVAGRLLDGPLAGAVAALLVTSSPLVQTYFSQARTEGLLAALTSAALVAVIAVARRFERDGLVPRAAWATGLLLGLALATKLTAALAIIATGAYGLAAMLRLIATRRDEAVRIGAWTAATLAFAALVWVAVNPFLWPDPIGRTWSMLDQQSSIMVEQGEKFGGAIDDGIGGRVLLVAYRTFVENEIAAFDANLPPGSPPLVRPSMLGLTGAGVSVELLLALAGCVLVVGRAASGWIASERPGSAMALLCWVLAYWLGIAANLSLDWPRYYVPTACIGSLLVGLAVSAAVRFALALRVRAVPAGAIARGTRAGAAH